MKDGRVQVVTKYNMAAFLPKEDDYEESVFTSPVKEERPSHEGKVRTVNKFNKAAFMPKDENLFAFGDPLRIGTNVGGRQFSFDYSGSKTGTLGTGQGGAQPSGINWNFDSDAAARDVELIRGIDFNSPVGKKLNTPAINSTVQQGIARSGYNPSSTASEIKSLTSSTSPTSSSGSSGFFGKGGAGTAAAGAALGIASNIGQSETNKRGLFDVMDPVHQLAGGRESAVGNALGDAGVGVFQAGVSTGNPWIMAAGAGLKVIGGLTNAAFGIKEDKEKKAAADASIASNQNFMSNAESFDDIKGPASATATDVYEGGWFSGGKADRKNAELARRMANAYSWADRSILNNVQNLQDVQTEDFLRNYSAFGGYLTRPKRKRKVKR